MVSILQMKYNTDKQLFKKHYISLWRNKPELNKHPLSMKKTETKCLKLIVPNQIGKKTVIQQFSVVQRNT